jgi:GNAT superfamily N-acetyltransferase
MPHLTSSQSARPCSLRHHWRRELTELAALFGAVATADVVADLVAHGPDGPVLLGGSAVALLATAGFHSWWSRHHGHPPPSAGSGAAPAITAAAPAEPAEGAVWRLRTTVRDEPGSLAALCKALADLSVDILTLQTHPLAEGGTVDELLLRVPGSTTPGEVTRAVTSAGARDTWVERADAHDLVDTPTRMLVLSARTVADAAELPLALRQLFGRCTIRSVPASSLTEGERRQDVLDDTVMRLREPSGGVITVERPYLPFTPTEFARARALVELEARLDARLGARLPDSRDVLALPEGNEITVRRAGPEDMAAVRAMHGRCSGTTLAQRYHGPVDDADRYLEHLLSRRFGQTLAMETGSGRLVALGHLLWDGDESEVALIVEDAWQRRGIGSELLRRLIRLAADAGVESVYAVTQAANTGMVATMRGLGLPLDYQVADGTLVVTGTLAGVDVSSPAR